jgi:hypothetical protein
MRLRNRGFEGSSLFLTSIAFNASTSPCRYTGNLQLHGSGGIDVLVTKIETALSTIGEYPLSAHFSRQSSVGQSCRFLFRSSSGLNP